MYFKKLNSMLSVAKVLPKVSPAIASAKHNLNKLYCKFAIAVDLRKSQVVNLPIVDSLDFGDGIFTDIHEVTVKYINPELYFYFTMFDSVYTDNFREVLNSWGFEVKPSYHIIDINDSVLTLVTTGDELYCYDLFGRLMKYI